MTGQRKIGVLMGGLSAERDVSMRSGEAIVAALTDRGYDAWPLFVDRDVDLVLRQSRIDVAFLALHGRYGEDGCIQGLLELLGIPYTGSGVLASALAMNKARAKEVFRLHNLPTPPGYVVEADSGEDLLELHGSFGFPVVVKPAGEGSSLGTRVARDELELESAVEDALRFDDDVLVERFIEGKEISVGILDGKPLGAVEIVPKRGFYDFHNKYTGGRTDYHLPARLSPERYRSVLRLATLAHEALGCEGATPRRPDRQRTRQRGDPGGQHAPGHDPDQPAAQDRPRRRPLLRGSGRGVLQRRPPARPRPPARSPRGSGRLRGPRAPHRLHDRRALAAPRVRGFSRCCHSAVTRR